MNLSAHWRSGLLLIAFAVAAAEPSDAAAPVDTTLIAGTIKADVARLVAGINAHDAIRATAYDASNVISMECGSSPTIGVKADREGFQSGFARDSYWRVSLIDETVDVASAGDLAIYRGTYHEENSRAGILMTHKTNFIAEFKNHGDGSWKIDWYIVANMEKSHPQRR